MAHARWSWLVGAAVFSFSACGEVAEMFDAPKDVAGDTAGSADAPLADVNGTVLDVFGTPLAGAKVRIGTEVFTTAGDGQFHITAVPPTYDLDVVTSETSGLKRVTAYRGLTSRTPEVGVAAQTTQTTSVSGTTTGITFPLPANQHLILADTEQYFGFDQPFVVEITGTPFSGGTGVWFGKPTFEGTLWAIQYTQPGSTITAYNSYARFVTTMTAGTPKSTIISTTPLSTATLSGTVSSLPPGSSAASVEIAMKHASDPFGHFVGSSVSTTGAFSLPTPSAGSISVNVVADAGTSSAGIDVAYRVWKANVPSNATNVNIAFGTAPMFSAPANNSTGIRSDANLSWLAGTPAGVYKIIITCAAGSNYAATVFTTSMSFQLPETAALGAMWPTAKSCTWEIMMYGATSVDTVVGANGLNKLERMNGPVDGAWSQTRGFGFTTE